MVIKIYLNFIYIICIFIFININQIFKKYFYYFLFFGTLFAILNIPKQANAVFITARYIANPLRVYLRDKRTEDYQHVFLIV